MKDAVAVFTSFDALELSRGIGDFARFGVDEDEYLGRRPAIILSIPKPDRENAELATTNSHNLVEGTGLRGNNFHLP